MSALATIDSLPPLMSFDGVFEEFMAFPEADSADASTDERQAHLIAITDAIIEKFGASKVILERLVADTAMEFRQMEYVDIVSPTRILRSKSRHIDREFASAHRTYLNSIAHFAKYEKQARRQRRRNAANLCAIARHHVARIWAATSDYLTCLRTTPWRLLELKAEAEGSDIELTDQTEYLDYLAWKLQEVGTELKATVAEAAEGRKRIDANIGAIVKHQKRTDRVLAGMR